MSAAVYLPLLASVVLAVLAPMLAQRLPPGRGAWLLTAAGVATGLSTVWALLLLTGTMIDDLPGLLQVEPADDSIAVGAGIAALAGALRAGYVAIVRSRLNRGLRRICREAGGGDLVVLADPEPRAFAVPGRPGHVVVTDAMLRALTLPQRRVLLAHEHAHLHARHSRMLAAVDTAAAVNPLLVPLRRAVAFLCERWADEVAAGAVGNRALAAEALATAALASSLAGPARTAMAFQELSVVRRVAALRSPPPPLRYWRLIVALAVVLCGTTLAADLDATAHFIDLASRLTGRG